MKHPVLERISTVLLRQERTIAVAESVTSGYLQFLLSNMTGASDIFQGGITVYNCAQKARHLCVEPIHAYKRMGVGADISATMAREVAKMFNAALGVGITGFAEENTESADGIMAYLSISNDGKEVLAKKLSSSAPDFASRQADFADQTCALLEHLLNTLY